MATLVGSMMTDVLGAALDLGTSGHLGLCCSISKEVVSERKLTLEMGPAIALAALLPIECVSPQDIATNHSRSPNAAPMAERLSLRGDGSSGKSESLLNSMLSSPSCPSISFLHTSRN